MLGQYQVMKCERYHEMRYISEKMASEKDEASSAEVEQVMCWSKR